MVKGKITTKIKMRLAFMGVLFLVLLYGAVSQHISLGQSYQNVYFDNTLVCSVEEKLDVKTITKELRRTLASEASDKLAMDYRLYTEKADTFFVKLTSEAEFRNLLHEKLKGAVVQNGVKSYTVGIDEYRASFASMEELLGFFAGVKANADENGEYVPVITKTEGHIQGVMTAVLEPVTQKPWDIKVEPVEGEAGGVTAGVSVSVNDALAHAIANPYESTWRFGILDIQYIDPITIYEDFVSEDELSDVATEVSEVTKEKETNKIYVVKSGDSLSKIAYEHDTTVASIVQLNGLKNQNFINIDDELIIAVPEPDLKLRVIKGEIYEEDYNAEPTIILNDSWYTTKKVVHYEGTTGHRERNDIVTIENGVEVKREMIHENVIIESEPAIIEQGTIIPPTYIKPIYGGRKTSGYGQRWGKLHKGVDWAVPTGTKIFASSAGTVVRADRNGSYGLCVLISHPDGRMTRYAHCSKLLVSKGQSVKQGETIALSGNTGRSTGPHLHFEMIINGSPVNPLKYIK